MHIRKKKNLRTKSEGGVKLVFDAPRACLSLKPPSSEWIFLCERSSIYTHIYCCIWVEIMGYYLKHV